MKKIVSFLLLMCVAGTVLGAPAKKGNDAAILLPALSSEIDRFWPDIPRREFLAGIFDQESNMKIDAHLRTVREHGCGPGQFTIAYNKDGSTRFDALAETRRLDPSLANWNWKDCTNVIYQSRGLVLKTKAEYRDCALGMNGTDNALKCTGAKYNGGAGSVNKRKNSCRLRAGCDPRVWDNNLDQECPQSKVKVHGYGESFCEINSKYPSRVFTRMVKYKGKV